MWQNKLCLTDYIQKSNNIKHQYFPSCYYFATPLSICKPDKLYKKIRIHINDNLRCIIGLL